MTFLHFPVYKGYMIFVPTYAFFFASLKPTKPTLKFVRYSHEDGTPVICEYCGCDRFDLYDTYAQYPYIRECSACGAPHSTKD